MSIRKAITNPIRTAALRLMVLLALPVAAMADPLDDISLQQQGEVVLATIKLTSPVHFVRFAPSGNSRIMEIVFERVPGTSTSETWEDREVRSSPESMQIPAFTVSTRDQDTQPKLVVEFARDVEFTATPGADSRSFIFKIKPEKKAAPVLSNISLPLLPTVQAPVAEKNEAGAMVVSEITQQGHDLMIAGRDALSAKNYTSATEVFNKLLMLPPNQYSQEAQEWVGVSRERLSQIAKAKVEYELYLKLYTTEPGVQRVKQRLAGLGKQVVETAKMGATSKKFEPKSFVQGGISSRYYWGQTTLDTTYPFNNTTQTSQYSLVDQSSLISNIDATARYVNETYDNRIVFRDVLTKNFLPKQADRNRLNSAYIEVKDRTADYSARLGRQNTGGGGVMGRFDGVSAGYGSVQDLRVNAVAGQLVDFTAYAQPVFYGISVDRGPLSIYLVNQTLEGILDRRALGAEYKYFETGKMAFVMVDYDIYFKALNSAMLTGTMSLEGSGTTFNFMADYRKNPAYSTRNAMNGANTTSLTDLLASMNEAQLHQLAIDRTGSSTYSQFGITQKLSVNWQVGGDIKLSKMSGLPATGTLPASGIVPLSGVLPATPDTGLEKTITAQLIGSNLYSSADITSMGTSLISSDYIQSGQSVFIYNRTSWDRELYFDASWNYYRQSDSYGVSMVRNMPMLRVSYQMLQKLSLDADMGFELMSSSGLYQSSVNKRIFGSLGLRWDF